MSDDSVIGTPLRCNATKVLICGAGELGKEVAIELQRYGVEVIAVDRYANAPAMQVAHKSHVLSMLDGPALREIVETHRPDYIVPEIEAIATDTLLELESEGYHVIPSAKATSLTMNREGIRRLAAQELHLPTSPFRFASNFSEMTKALEEIGCPAFVKPIMSSSGKGQSKVSSIEDARAAWTAAQEGGRAGNGRVIVEGFVDFDYEITLLTVRTGKETLFCEPIGHEQVDGDYRMSYQPKVMSEQARRKAEHIARTVTDALGGRGVFGVELFVCKDEVIFSEVSPRPHDTGLVTLISQELSQFALHARAILGLPIPTIEHKGPSASVAILGEGESELLSYRGIAQALQQPQTEVRLFGKPEVRGLRRLGVALARGGDLDKAIEKAGDVSRCIKIMKDEGTSHDI